MEVVSVTLSYIFDTFYYMFVVVSWNLRQVWNRLGKSSDDEIDDVQKTPQNRKGFTPIMRSTRPASSRRIISKYPTPIQYKSNYRKPTPQHISKNLFGNNSSDELEAYWDPNRTFFVSYYKYNNYLQDDLSSFRPL